MRVFHIYCTIAAEILSGYYVCMISLQKKIGCFNHRVVTMVVDKLKRQWFNFGNRIKQPEKQLSNSSYNHNTQTIH